MRVNWIDFFIVLWLLLSVARGYRIGFLRQVLSFGGFLAGLLLAGWLSPYIPKAYGETTSPLLLSLLVMLGLGIGLAAAGERIALWIQASHKWKPTHLMNSLLGIFTSAIFVFVASWLVASTLTKLPFGHIGLIIEQSRIVRAMDRVMPPAPAVMDRLGQLISPEGFPQVFVGPEPEIDPAGPPVTPEVEAAATKARASVVRVEGFACGNISAGSGFVAAPKHVVTNAHVVAGMREPVVFDQGRRLRAAVVLYDPSLDLAVLRTNRDLSGKPLALADQKVPRGTSTAVLGFPGGGSLRISPAVILRSQLAVGRDIYNRNIVSREIYALQSNIEQGNSGGPVVLPNGRVAGVVFGAAATRDGIGYALTFQAIADRLDAALDSGSIAPTGRCL